MERDLPEGWEWTTLGELVLKPKADIVDGPFGSNLKASEYVDEGIPIIRLQNIQRDAFIKKEIRFVTQEKAAQLKRHSFSKSDIVITKLGDPLGKACLVPDDLDWGIIVADVIRIRPDEKRILKKYLLCAINSDVVSRQFDVNIRGATRPRINLGHVRKLRIPLPPLETQRRIVAILEKAEETKRLRAQADELADRLLQSVFLEMFGDPVTNPMGWKYEKIKNISEKFSDGPFGSNLKTEHYTDEGIRVIRLQNIGVSKFLDEDKAYISEEHFTKIKKHKCATGDVIIGTMGNPNLRACIIPKYVEIAVNKADCIQCRPKKRAVLPEYICSLLNIPATLIMATNMIHGQTRSRISMGQLSTLSIPVPPLSLQMQFTQIVEKIEAIKQSQVRSNQELDDLFNALMQKAFKGELFA